MPKKSYQKHFKKEKYEQLSLNTKLQCFHLYQMQINFLWSEDNILTGKRSVNLIQNQSYKMKSDKNLNRSPELAKWVVIKVQLYAGCFSHHLIR